LISIFNAKRVLFGQEKVPGTRIGTKNCPKLRKLGAWHQFLGLWEMCVGCEVFGLLMKFAAKVFF
jgi:hypothetical protein